LNDSYSFPALFSVPQGRKITLSQLTLHGELGNGNQKQSPDGDNSTHITQHPKNHVNLKDKFDVGPRDWGGC